MYSLERRGFLALDDMTADEALAAMRLYTDDFFGMKLNDVLMGEVGAERLVAEAANYGCPFVDPKLHDTWQTVANTVKKLARAGAYCITAHASGGVEMLAAAQDAFMSSKQAENLGAGILGVTVLTSLDDGQCKRTYVTQRMDTVLRLAGIAAEAKVWGVVCSAADAALITREFPHLKKVVPGTRLAGGAAGSQKNITLPSVAFHNGADFIVVGSDVLAAKDPAARIEQYNQHLVARD